MAVEDTHLARLLQEAQRSLSDELIQDMTERGYLDIKAGHAAVFANIDRRAGTRLTELARRARMSKQGMMLMVDELEERGYVRRVPDPDDGRPKVVKLTASGRRCDAEARRVTQAVAGRTRRPLGPGWGDRAWRRRCSARPSVSPAAPWTWWCWTRRIRTRSAPSRAASTSTGRCSSSPASRERPPRRSRTSRTSGTRCRTAPI